jgi:hypothetical protein
VSARAEGLGAEAVAALARGAREVRVEGENLILRVADEESLPELLRHLVESGARVYSFHTERLSLEDLFLRIVGTEGGL